MIIDFPSNPSTDDTFTVQDSTYTFDGVKWTINSTVTEAPNDSVINYVVKSSNYTASVGDGVLTDTTNGSFTIALPSSPSLGDSVIIADGKDFWGINNLFIDPNGNTIEGFSDDLIADVSSISVNFVYDGTTWVTYAQLGAAQGDAVTTENSVTLINKTLDDPILNLDGTEGVDGQFVISQGSGQPLKFASSSDLLFNSSTGTLSATEVNSLSDRRLKDNVQTIDSALDKTLALNGVSFTFKNTGKDSIGLIAQDVNEVVPEVVEHNEETDTYTVSYGNLVGLLIEAIKEQQAEIDSLKNKMDGK